MYLSIYRERESVCKKQFDCLWKQICVYAICMYYVWIVCDRVCMYPAFFFLKRHKNTHNAHTFNTCSRRVFAGGAWRAGRSCRGSRSNWAICASSTHGAGAGGGAHNSRVFAGGAVGADGWTCRASTETDNKSDSHAYVYMYRRCVCVCVPIFMYVCMYHTYEWMYACIHTHTTIYEVFTWGKNTKRSITHYSHVLWNICDNQALIIMYYNTRTHTLTIHTYTHRYIYI